MRFFITIFAFWLALVTGAHAQDYEKGMKAARLGDYPAALAEWRPLAYRGDPLAQFNLGTMYSNGFGVPQNYAKAVKWYRMSAYQGFAFAQFNLANMYLRGEGVRRDYITAHMWFNISSANGERDAADKRDRIGARLASAEVARAQARATTCLKSHYTKCH